MKPFALDRTFGVSNGTITAITGFVFIQLGFEGIAPLSWADTTASSVIGGLLVIGGLTWNGLSYLLERLDREGAE